jgi:excisionase family DNA binding protein
MGKYMVDDKQMVNMLTVREVARLLHIHPNTLRRWSNRGRIRAYRITPRGDRRFKREEIARFLAEFNAQGGNWRESIPDDGHGSQ